MILDKEVVLKEVALACWTVEVAEERCQHHLTKADYRCHRPAPPSLEVAEAEVSCEQQPL